MKKSGTKRALLLSVLSVVLCLSMLVGSTFAWFTDSVSTGVNKIVAGNLDIKLEYKNSAEADWTEVDKNTNIFIPADSTLWEPGHTEYAYLRVSNVGSLALKSSLSVKVYGDENGAAEKAYTSVDGTQFKLSEKLVFVQKDGAEPISGREALWMTDAAAEKAAMGDLSGLGLSELALKPGESKELTLAVYMPTQVGNEANQLTSERNSGAPTIFLGISLAATQDTVERDSFDELYDKNAFLEMTLTDNQNGTYSDTNDQLYVKSAGEYIPVTQYVGSDGNAVEGRYTDENGGNYVASGDAMKSVFKDTEAVKNDIALIGDITYAGTATGTATTTNNLLYLAADTTFDLGGNTLTINSTQGRDGVNFTGGTFESNPTGSQATISNGTIVRVSDKTNTGSTYAVVVASETVLTLNDTIVTAQDSASFAVRAAGYKGTQVILNDCTITGKIMVGSQATLKINGGCVNGKIDPQNNAVVEITSGKFSEQPKTNWLASGSTLSAEAIDGYWVVTAAS